MPDLQSELQAKLSSISFDDSGELSQRDDDTDNSNTTKMLFEYIAKNPNASGKHLRAVFQKNGYADGISTRLKQMFNRGIVNRYRRGGVYFYTTAVEAYPPRGGPKVSPRRKAVRHSKPAVTQQRVVAPTDVQHIMNSISIATAKALYEELRQAFGK